MFPSFIFIKEHVMLIKDQIKLWNGRRYYSLDCYLKNTFNKKLYKLSLDGGMTCPNRDGRISKGGCIFCSAGGSGEFTADRSLSINEQISQAKEKVSRKTNGEGYIAYFQAFTNTYAPCDYLERLFMPVIMRDDIDVLSIATRPDCLESDKLRLLSRLRKIKPIWVELGLQTSKPESARLINRGYELSCFESAVNDLKSIGAEVIVHTIAGLPYETHEDMINTITYAAKSGADGIKLQLLHVLKGTVLAEMYRKKEFEVLSQEEYISLLCDMISVLPPQTVIHRLTGDGDKRLLIAPLWSGDKRNVLNSLNHQLKARNIIQGCALK